MQLATDQQLTTPRFLYMTTVFSAIREREKRCHYHPRIIVSFHESVGLQNLENTLAVIAYNYILYIKPFRKSPKVYCTEKHTHIWKSTSYTQKGGRGKLCIRW